MDLGTFSFHRRAPRLIPPQLGSCRKPFRSTCTKTRSWTRPELAGAAKSDALYNAPRSGYEFERCLTDTAIVGCHSAAFGTLSETAMLVSAPTHSMTHNRTRTGASRFCNRHSWTHAAVHLVAPSGTTPGGRPRNLELKGEFGHFSGQRTWLLSLLHSHCNPQGSATPETGTQRHQSAQPSLPATST